MLSILAVQETSMSRSGKTSSQDRGMPANLTGSADAISRPRPRKSAPSSRLLSRADSTHPRASAESSSSIVSQLPALEKSLSAGASMTLPLTSRETSRPESAPPLHTGETDSSAPASSAVW